MAKQKRLTCGHELELYNLTIKVIGKKRRAICKTCGKGRITTA